MLNGEKTNLTCDSLPFSRNHYVISILSGRRGLMCYPLSIILWVPQEGLGARLGKSLGLSNIPGGKEREGGRSLTKGGGRLFMHFPA